MAQLLANNAATTLSAGITSGAVSLTVASIAGFPTIQNPGTDYWYATISDLTEDAWEVVKVIAQTGAALTVQRGLDGTTAQAWSGGSNFQVRTCAQMLRELTGAGQLLQSYLVTIGSNITNFLTTMTAPCPITSGVQVATYTITPTVVGSRIRVRARGSINSSATSSCYVAIYLGTPTNANAFGLSSVQTGNYQEPSAVAEMVTTSLAPITVSVRMGSDTYTTGNIQAQSFSMEVEEIGLPNTNLSPAASWTLSSADTPPANPAIQNDEFTISGGLGSKWQAFYSGYSSLDVNTSTVGCLNIKTTGTSGAGGTTAIQPLPAGDFTAWAKVQASYAGNYDGQGLMILDGNTQGAGHQTMVEMYYSSGWLVRSTNSTSFGSQTYTPVGAPGSNATYLRLRAVSGVYYAAFSSDGNNWTEITITPGFTPTYIGLQAYTTGIGANVNSIDFDFFRLVSGNGAAVLGGTQQVGSGLPAYGTVNNGQVCGVVGGAPAWVSSTGIQHGALCFSTVDMAGGLTESNAANQTCATEFVPSLALTCNGARFYGYAGRSYKVSLWQNGVRLQAVTTGALGSSGVTTALFGTGQVLTPYLKYYISIWEVTGTYYSKALQASTPLVSNYSANPWIWIVNSTSYFDSGDSAPNATAVTESYAIEPIVQ